MSYKPNREEVETFLQALNYGMKVEYKKDFMIYLAEAWLSKEKDSKEEITQDLPKSLREFYLPAGVVAKGDLVRAAGSPGRYSLVEKTKTDGVMVTLCLADTDLFTYPESTKMQVLR